MVQRVQALSNTQALLFAGALFAVFAWLPFIISVYAYLVMGQAHLVQTFLHHARTGKVTKPYLLIALVCFLLLFAYIVFSSAFIPLLLIIALMFALHGIYGEYKLRGESLTRARTVFGFGAVVVLWAIVASTVLPYKAWLLALLLVGVLLMIGRRAFIRDPLSHAETYILLVVVACLCMGYVAQAPGNVFGALITLHVINWTLYGSALAKAHGTFLRYWIETLCLYVATFSAFLLFIFGGAPFLKVFFEPLYYYAWSVGHIVLTSTLPLLFGKK